MLRLLVNQWEKEQQLLVGGISQLTWKFYTQPVTMPNGQTESLQSLNAVVLNTPIVNLESGAGQNPKLTLKIYT